MSTVAVDSYAKFPVGTHFSTVVDLRSHVLSGIVMSQEWTPADISFQVAIDPTFPNWQELRGTNDEPLIVSADANRFYAIDRTWFEGAPYIRLRSGRLGEHVAQTSQRVLGLILRSY